MFNCYNQNALSWLNIQIWMTQMSFTTHPSIHLMTAIHFCRSVTELFMNRSDCIGIDLLRDPREHNHSRVLLRECFLKFFIHPSRGNCGLWKHQLVRLKSYRQYETLHHDRESKTRVARSHFTCHGAAEITALVSPRRPPYFGATKSSVFWNVHDITSRIPASRLLHIPPLSSTGFHPWFRQTPPHQMHSLRFMSSRCATATFPFRKPPPRFTSLAVPSILLFPPFRGCHEICGLFCFFLFPGERVLFSPQHALIF